MTSAPLRLLSPADPAFDGLKAALAAAGLPTDDLLEDGARYFAWRDDQDDAFSGLVLLGEEALLRSVVVRPDRRGQGVGREALAATAAWAAQASVRRLWLLTTGAERFFEREGWIAVERSAAPGVIATTRQFSATCPASATLMTRTLG